MRLSERLSGGALAGLITGVLHTKLRIQAILAGILVMLASYSINLRIMGKTPNIPLTKSETIYKAADALLPPKYAGIAVGFAVLIVVIIALYLFLQTRLGFVFRATGDNEDMVRACGVSCDAMKLMGFALSNGLVGLSGGMLAQNQAFADINSGVGMMVIGLASVILGEVVFGTKSLGRRLVAASLGAILYRIILSQGALSRYGIYRYEACVCCYRSRGSCARCYRRKRCKNTAWNEKRRAAGKARRYAERCGRW